MLALQGGVAEHVRTVEDLGARAAPIRRPEHLVGPDGPRIDALILPGGESGAIERIATRLGVFEPLREAVLGGLPTLGTCAGLVLLATRLQDPSPGQRTLGALDVAVRRNAFGPQLVSTEAEFEVDAPVKGIGADGRVRGALIRAPEVTAVGSAARAIVRHDGHVLGATSVGVEDDALGTVTGVSFHPELSGDPAFHRALLTQARRR